MLAQLIRMRFDNTVRKLGLDQDRPELRTDLFVKPTASAVAKPSSAPDRARQPRHERRPPVAEQLSLI